MENCRTIVCVCVCVLRRGHVCMYILSKIYCAYRIRTQIHTIHFHSEICFTIQQYHPHRIHAALLWIVSNVDIKHVFITITQAWMDGCCFNGLVSETQQGLPSTINVSKSVSVTSWNKPVAKTEILVEQTKWNIEKSVARQIQILAFFQILIWDRFLNLS